MSIKNKMKKLCLTLGFLGLVPIGINAKCYDNKVNYEIATGSKTGTYFQIGKNLSSYIAPDACINLKVLNSNGSIDNVLKLRSPEYKRLKFAIVQNDVLQELKVRAENGDKNSIDLVNSLRVIKALYNEEIHLLTRVNSDVNTFADLKNKRISVGTNKSGTAMTSKLLYKELFNENLKKFSFQTFDEGLKDLHNNKVDVIVKVAGQPVSRLSKKMKANASKFIKLVSYNEKNKNHNEVTSYYNEDILAKNYPWLNKDVSSLSTKAFLITFNYQNPATKRYLKKFFISLNNKINFLKTNASSSEYTPHLKWKQVSSECSTELPGGWEYHSIVNEVCNNNSTTYRGSNSSNKGCSEYDRSLGLCN